MILIPGESLEELVYDDMREVLDLHGIVPHYASGYLKIFHQLNLKSLDEWVSLFDTSPAQREACLCHIENQLIESGVVKEKKQFLVTIPAKISPPKMSWWQRFCCWLSPAYLANYADDQFEDRNVLAQEIAIQNGWVECHPIDPGIQAEVSRIMRKHGL